MNKENKKSKKTLIALIAIAIAVTIAIIVTTVVISLNSGTPDEGIIDNNPISPSEPDNPNDPSKPDNPDNPGSDLPDPPGDNEPTIVESKYGAPLLSYSLGQEFNVTEMVWSDTLKWFSTHNGTDFHAEKGDIVTAVYGGTVESVKYTTQHGYVVTVKQTDGKTAQYMSLSGDTLVEEGASVSKGTQIGYVSDSMSNEQNEGAHLHLEIVDADGEFVNPMSLLPAASDK